MPTTTRRERRMLELSEHMFRDLLSAGTLDADDVLFVNEEPLYRAGVCGRSYAHARLIIRGHAQLADVLSSAPPVGSRWIVLFGRDRHVWIGTVEAMPLARGGVA